MSACHSLWHDFCHSFFLIFFLGVTNILPVFGSSDLEELQGLLTTCAG